VSDLSLGYPPVTGDYRVMDEPSLRRDYSALWRLPPPLPPMHWPRALLALVAGVILYALLFGSAD
jgi:hypothetical protein